MTDFGLSVTRRLAHADDPLNQLMGFPSGLFARAELVAEHDLAKGSILWVDWIPTIGARWGANWRLVRAGFEERSLPRAACIVRLVYIGTDLQPSSDLRGYLQPFKAGDRILWKVERLA